MSVLIADRHQAGDYLAKRHLSGLDKNDEVWDGVTVIMPLPTDEHQAIVTKLSSVISAIHNFREPPHVRAGVNVSDRVAGWTDNYRCPDVAVFLANSSAVNCDTHWCGGPDFLAEVVSQDDQSRAKLHFYSSVAAREVLIIDRDPWQLELFQLQGKLLVSIGTSSLGMPDVLVSSTLPLSIKLVTGPNRPQIELVDTKSGNAWQI